MAEWKEYKLRITAYTPDTIPMSRLAEYLSQQATLLGETPYVHFVKLEAGSTVAVIKINKEAVPKVEERAAAIRRHEGTAVEMRAYRRLNNMLQEDNGTAALLEDTGAEILVFPGTEEKLRFTSVQQHGELDGEVIRIGGKNDLVPITLDVEGMEITHCYAKRGIAKELGRNLFEPVRLYGTGNWGRSPDGEWSLTRFVVERFEVLRDEPLSKTVLALRGLQGDWGNNALHELLSIRGTNGEAH